MAKRPIPGRPTVASGVPTPVSWGGPSQSLSKMATQIGTNRALSEFYKVMVESQLEYDEDEHEFGLDRLRDNRRHRQEIDLQDHREYLKTGESGLGNRSSSANVVSESKTGDLADAAAQRLTSGSSTAALEGIVADREFDGERKTKVETTVEAKKKAAAEKKAEEDEKEMHWWSEAASDVGDFIGNTADTVTPDVIGEGIRVTGGKVADTAGWAADTPIGGAVMDVGKSAFRQLSRPLHATAGAADEWFKLDKEEGNTSDFMKYTNFLTGGQSPSESLDDVSLEGIGEVFKGFGRGFMLDDKKTFSDVLRHNAERDNEYNVFDSKTHQTITGIGEDLILDPLNLIGVGLVTKPVQIAKAAGRAKEIRGIADEAVKLGVQRPKVGMGPDIPLGVDEVVGMLTPGRYTSKAQRVADIPRLRHNADALSEAIARVRPVGNAKTRAIEAKAAELQTQLKVVTAKHGSSVAIEELTAGILKQEMNGEVPSGTVDQFYTELDSAKVMSAFKKTWSVKNPAARQKAFDDALGDDWKNNPALTDADRTALFNDMYKNAARNPAFKDVMGHNQTALAEKTKAEAHLSLMEKRGNADDVAEARAALNLVKEDLKRLSPQVNAARIQSFQQVAMARSMENLGKPLYSDPERANQLQAIMDTVESKLAEIQTVPLKSGEARGIEHDIDPTRATPNTGSTGGRRTHGTKDELENAKAPGHELTNEDQQFFDPDLDDIESVLAASPDSFNYESQLQAAYTKADKELKGLKQDYASFEKTNIEIPEALQGEGGMLDSQKFFDHVAPSGEDLLKFEAQPSGDPAIDEWMNGAVAHYNRYVKDEFKRLKDNAIRRSDEDALKNATADVNLRDLHNLSEQGDPKAAKLLTMFSKPRQGTKTDKADANLYPHIDVNGKKVHETEAENLPGRVDAELSETYSDWVKNPAKMSEEDTEHLASLLGSVGLSVGNSPEGIFRYVLGHKDALLDAVSPAKLAFAQEFKKQHGMTLQEAKDMRAGYTGNSVGMALDDAEFITNWQKAHPYGVSEPSFVREVMSAVDEDSLMKVLDGSPISVTIPKFVDTGRKSPAFRKFSGAGAKGNEGWKKLYKDADAKGVKQSLLAQAKKNLNAALKDAGLPKTATLEDVRTVWAHDVLEWMEDANPAKLRDDLKKNWRNRFDASKKRNADAITAKARATAGTLDASAYAELRIAAYNKARGKFVENIDNGQSLTKNSDKMLIPYNTESIRDTVTRVAQVKKSKIDEQIDTLREGLKVAKATSNGEDIRNIEKQIASLRDEWKAEKSNFDAALKTATESARVLQTRVKEEALLSIANATVDAGKKSLNLNLAGKAINIKGSAAMFEAAEKAAGLPGLKRFAMVYREAFASQRNLLPDDMQVIANRALSNPSEVIGYHVRDIKKTLGRTPFAERKATLRGILSGSGAGDDAVKAAINNHMERLLPYFQGKAPVGGKEEYISMFEINRYLPDKFKFEKRGVNQLQFETPHQLLNSLAMNAKRNGHKIGDLDPIEIVWSSRIATEQAMARHALEHSVGEVFGVRRLAKVNWKDGTPYNLRREGDAAQAIEKLKEHGWTPIKELGNKHLFPPESVQDIKRMLDMFEPRNVGKVGKFIDEVTGMWKTSVTIYNVPGYYVRNGIGEAMSAWLGGVHSATPFRKANDARRFLKNEGAELEALRDHMPALAHMMKGETTSELGRKHAVTLQNGQEINIERVTVLYRDQGLSSGFINTEYNHHYSKRKEQLKAIPGAKTMSRGNERLRESNERYEDFYRMGHFIDKLGKAPKGMSEKAASEWAAKEVRKYHFDYTDFTKAEKTVMLRAFPFYKWTRKALPLMSSMLFVKPGKMMAYPKIASGTSDAMMNSEDMDPDSDNGFMPNYEGFVPPFVNDNWAYQVAGEPGETGAFARVATPQMDSLNTASNPVSSAWNLFNPMFKEPLEQIAGVNAGNMNLPMEDGQDRIDSLAGNTPQTAQLNNLFKKMGLYGSDEDAASVMNKDDLIRLLTGMGYYENAFPNPYEED